MDNLVRLKPQYVLQAETLINRTRAKCTSHLKLQSGEDDGETLAGICTLPPPPKQPPDSVIIEAIDSNLQCHL